MNISPHPGFGNGMYMIHRCGARVLFTHNFQRGRRVLPSHFCPKCRINIEGPSLDLIWVNGRGSHLWARIKIFFNHLRFKDLKAEGF